MPKVTSDFLKAVNGTVHDPNGYLVTTSTPTRNLWGTVISESFATVGTAENNYTFTAGAYTVLSDIAAAVHASGTGVIVNNATVYSVIILGSQIDVQQVSQ